MPSDPRIARLRNLDTNATKPPWRSDRLSVWRSNGGLRLADAETEVDAALIAAMRNAWPAMVTLVEGIERHSRDENGPQCGLCHDAVLAVLDTLDPP